eukprot:scaffold1253_cov245-Pinguiococcus_pyrenoidosus.AAC.18
MHAGRCTSEKAKKPRSLPPSKADGGESSALEPAPRTSVQEVEQRTTNERRKNAATTICHSPVFVISAVQKPKKLDLPDRKRTKKGTFSRCSIAEIRMEAQTMHFALARLLRRLSAALPWTAPEFVTTPYNRHSQQAGASRGVLKEAEPVETLLYALVQFYRATGQYDLASERWALLRFFSPRCEGPFVTRLSMDRLGGAAEAGRTCSSSGVRAGKSPTWSGSSAGSEPR